MSTLLKSITLKSIPAGYQNSFKTQFPFEKRKEDADKIKSKHPNSVPVIVELVRGSKSELLIDKTKYLVPEDLTIQQFMQIIRKRIKMDAEQALFLYIIDANNKTIIPSMTGKIGEIYKNLGDTDGYLYLIYATENTFGCK